MKSLSIVVHVYAEEIPMYAKIFTAQLSGMIHWRPECLVDVQVWTTSTDALTHGVCRSFSSLFAGSAPNVSISVGHLDKLSLFRRAIGRNRSAMMCTSDVMWFADADYIPGEGCLDSIANIDFESLKPKEIAIPFSYMLQNSHADGDAEIARITPGELFVPNLKPYYVKNLTLAIGGLQIVPRETALRGYLNKTSWTRPRMEEIAFPDTHDDIRYRKSLSGGARVPISNLYRIRHSECSYESVDQRSVRLGRKQMDRRASRKTDGSE